MPIALVYECACADNFMTAFSQQQRTTLLDYQVRLRKHFLIGRLDLEVLFQPFQIQTLEVPPHIDFRMG